MLTCNEVADRLRDAAGGYDKTRVYNLQIDNKKVSDAVKRADDKHQSQDENPESAADRGPSHHPVFNQEAYHLGPEPSGKNYRGGKEETEGREKVIRRCCPIVESDHTSGPNRRRAGSGTGPILLS